MRSYDHKKIEKKWQQRWRDQHLYRTQENAQKPKSYVLDMFPYPSGDGLHVGHPKGYIATDIYSRKKRMEGHNILHPMGWDAFGLPAEQFAIKNKVHPRSAVEKNTARFKEQLSVIGFSYDWEREVNTTDSAFYKWTQWIFLKLYEKGLAYESHEPINWCPSCQTGLANEDLEGTTCERCGTIVEKRPMRQWVLKITDYADRMLEDLGGLTWPESIKESQRNWIGRNEGAEIIFTLQPGNVPLKVFTTRPDTLFGATYCVLAPEHSLVEELATSIKNMDEVRAYVAQAGKQTEIERTAADKEKTGVKLEGITAINPANKEEIPVFVADYVLGHYGTGAIMAVPAHDERDYAFAKNPKRDLKVIPVILPPKKNSLSGFQNHFLPKIPTGSNALDATLKKIKEQTKLLLQGETFYTGPGTLIKSGKGKFDEMDNEEAKKAITKFVGGKMTVQYKLRDWVFSRQRYWGEPIPIIHCEKCGVVPVPEDQLPVTLPDVEHYEPTGTGESPLAAIDEWVNTTCPTCGGPAKRETNTMPQWAGSSWYYLRYIDPHNDKALVDKQKEKYWSPVDLYVGGAEHATRHLIYARFWHKFLFDLGVVNYPEPFTRLEHVGIIMASDGRKMSKRYGNVINPDDIVATYGADTLRLYEMFMGPFSHAVAWSDESIIGPRRFIERLWRLQEKIVPEPVATIESPLHRCIKKVSADIESFSFNTAVAEMMSFLNEAESAGTIGKVQYETFLQILAPFAPHVTEELWETLGHAESVHLCRWPAHDETKITRSGYTIAVQVNGKLRGSIEVPGAVNQEEALEAGLRLENVRKWVEGKEIRKVIYVENRLLNLVV